MNIIPLIADLPAPTSTQLWDFIVPAGAIVGLIVLVKTLIPKPRTPPIEAAFVSREEFNAHRIEQKQELKAVLDKLDSMKADILVAGERRADAIGTRLNKVDELLARVDERTIKHA